MQQQIILNTYELCLVCVLMLQYLHLREGGKAKARAEKQSASPESSQIDAIQIQRKKHRFINFNLKMQKRFKGLLKILKSYKDLQESVSKTDRDNLNNFKNKSESSGNLFKSFKNTSEREIEPKNPNRDLNKDQFETE